MNISEYKAKLFEMIMSGKGLQEIVDDCSALLGNPFAFANRSFQLVFKSTSCDAFPDVFGWLDEWGEDTFKVADEAVKAGYFKAIYSSDAPVPGTITGLKANWMAARVRLKDQILGNILVSDSQTPFSGEYEELMPLVCQTVAYVLKQSSVEAVPSNNYESILVDLLEGSASGTDERILSHLKLLGHSIPREMRVLIARRVHSDAYGNRLALDAQLRSQFPTSLGVIFKNDCVRILDASLPLERIQERLSSYLNTEDYGFGLSRRFDSVLDLRDAYLQADAAIRLGNKAADGVNQFNDISGRYLLEQATAARHLSVKGMIVPEILALLSTGEDDRVQDLAAYMSCGRNVTRAAHIRNIHKNSMYYRLDRICELTGLAMDDDDVCVQVSLSLCLLGYLPYREKHHVLPLDAEWHK